MTIRTSKTPRLRGNTPTAILGWFKELERVGASFNPDYVPSEVCGRDMEPIFTAKGVEMVREDMAAAHRLCGDYRVCIYTIFMVATKSKPWLVVHQGRNEFGFTIIDDEKGGSKTVDGFKTREDAYDAFNHRENIEDFFIGDVCHVGLWFDNLPLAQKMPVIEQAAIGDFGPIFHGYLDVLEQERIRENDELQAAGKEVEDGFLDLRSGAYILNPHSKARSHINSAAATEYGFDYILWYKAGR